MHLFLIGYRGSGKSTVGALVAQELDRPWLDTDSLIQQQQGCSIAELFSRGGEGEFRRLERELLEQITASDQPPAVISLGGGAILDPVNQQRIRQRGATVWLTASAETLHQRIQSDPDSVSTRPPLTTVGGASEVAQLLQQRQPLYQQVAQWQISVEDRTPQEVARQIVNWWRQQPARSRD